MTNNNGSGQHDGDDTGNVNGVDDGGEEEDEDSILGGVVTSLSLRSFCTVSPFPPFPFPALTLPSFFPCDEEQTLAYDLERTFCCHSNFCVPIVLCFLSSPLPIDRESNACLHFYFHFLLLLLFLLCRYFICSNNDNDVGSCIHSNITSKICNHFLCFFIFILLQLKHFSSFSSSTFW